MEIRDVREDDFAAIAEITNHYIVNTAIHWGSEPVTADEVRAVWAKGAGRFPYLVAVGEGGRVDGYAKAGTWRDRAAYGRTAEVGVYLRDGLQGRGMGKRVYGRLIEECRWRGFHVLVGGIALPNEASVRLHEGLGFERVGVFREVGWKFGRWWDAVFYQLRL